MIYVYAIVEFPPPTVAGIRGVADAPVECVSAGGATAVCSAHATMDVRVDPETMWAHERVTAALLDRTPVVPVRFGTVLPGKEEVAALLEDGEDRYPALVAHLRGRVELALRARIEPVAGGSPPPASDAARTPGVAYLRSRRPGPLASPLRELHGTLAARSVDSSLRSTAEEMVAAYLAEAGDVGWFEACVARASRETPGLSTRLTGPWAPFSFTEVTAHAS